MKELNFIVDGQQLKKSANFPGVVEKSKDFLVARFDGIPVEYTCAAYFELSWERGNVYNAVIKDGSCILPEYCFTIPEDRSDYFDYIVSVSVSGTNEQGVRFTTNKVEINLQETSYSDETTNTPNIPESQFSELLALKGGWYVQYTYGNTFSVNAKTNTMFASTDFANEISLAVEDDFEIGNRCVLLFKTGDNPTFDVDENFYVYGDDVENEEFQPLRRTSYFLTVDKTEDSVVRVSCVRLSGYSGSGELEVDETLSVYGAAAEARETGKQLETKKHGYYDVVEINQTYTNVSTVEIEEEKLGLCQDVIIQISGQMSQKEEAGITFFLNFGGSFINIPFVSNTSGGFTQIIKLEKMQKDKLTTLIESGDAGGERYASVYSSTTPYPGSSYMTLSKYNTPDENVFSTISISVFAR